MGKEGEQEGDEGTPGDAGGGPRIPSKNPDSTCNRLTVSVKDGRAHTTQCVKVACKRVHGESDRGRTVQMRVLSAGCEATDYKRLGRSMCEWLGMA